MLLTHSHWILWSSPWQKLSQLPQKVSNWFKWFHHLCNWYWSCHHLLWHILYLRWFLSFSPLWKIVMFNNLDVKIGKNSDWKICASLFCVVLAFSTVTCLWYRYLHANHFQCSFFRNFCTASLPHCAIVSSLGVTKKLSCKWVTILLVAYPNPIGQPIYNSDSPWARYCWPREKDQIHRLSLQHQEHIMRRWLRRIQCRCIDQLVSNVYLSSKYTTRKVLHYLWSHKGQNLSLQMQWYEIMMTLVVGKIPLTLSSPNQYVWCGGCICQLESSLWGDINLELLGNWDVKWIERWRQRDKLPLCQTVRLAPSVAQLRKSELTIGLVKQASVSDENCIKSQQFLVSETRLGWQGWKQARKRRKPKVLPSLLDGSTSHSVLKESFW